MPNGDMLSMPIPSSADADGYSDLIYDGKSYYKLLREVKPSFRYRKCHLDPDIRPEIIERMDGWKPAFGQIDAARTHLCNQGVGIGDLFLFFGWFRETEYKNGESKYYIYENARDFEADIIVMRFVENCKRDGL